MNIATPPKVVKKHGRNKLFPKFFDMISGSKKRERKFFKIKDFLSRFIIWQPAGWQDYFHPRSLIIRS